MSGLLPDSALDRGPRPRPRMRAGHWTSEIQGPWIVTTLPQLRATGTTAVVSRSNRSAEPVPRPWELRAPLKRAPRGISFRQARSGAHRPTGARASPGI